MDGGIGEKDLPSFAIKHRLVLHLPAQRSSAESGHPGSGFRIERTKLLSVDTPVNSGALTKAIFPGGFVLSTKYLGEQKRASDWNGRQTARDFDKSAGSLFQIEGGKAFSEPPGFN